MSDVWDADGAAQFVMRSGGSFGYATNDADNTAGEYAVTASGVVTSEPWIGVIRASDMRLVRHDGDGSSLDPVSLARSLAQE